MMTIMYALVHTIMHISAGERQAHYRQMQHPSFPINLTKFRHCFQRATILYVLTAHKDCRKLSIPFRRFVDIFLVKEKGKKKKGKKENGGQRRAASRATTDPGFFLSRVTRSEVTSAPPRVIKANVASQYRHEDTARLDLSPIPVDFRPYVKKREERTAEFRFPSSFAIPAIAIARCCSYGRDRRTANNGSSMDQYRRYSSLAIRCCDSAPISLLCADTDSALQCAGFLIARTIRFQDRNGFESRDSLAYHNGSPEARLILF